MFVQTVLFAVAILFIKSSHAQNNVKMYCQLIQPGTKLPSIKSCQNYYSCSGDGTAVEFTCPANNVFDKDAQSCVPESASNCYFGLSNPCANKDRELTYSNKGCNWYNYCINGEIVGSGTCIIGERFYPANGSCIFGSCNDSADSTSVDVCEIMPDGMYFGDSENCQAWHKCSAMREESGVCENSLVFDVKSGYCLPNNGEMCHRTNNIVQSQASGPPKVACTSANQKAGDPNVCSIYYACQANTQTPATTYEWKELSCKNQKYFDVISQQCRDRTIARVYPECDRCEFTAGYSSSIYWANAVYPSCQKYFTCRNGRKLGTNIRSCEEDYFFDETAQVCIEGDERLKKYEVYNGACQNYTCNDLRQCSVPA